MNNECDIIDNMIFTYFEDKRVPNYIQMVIEQTNINKKTYIYTYIKRVAIILIIPVMIGIMYIAINLTRNNNKLLSNANNNLPVTETQNEIKYQITQGSGHISDYVAKSPQDLFNNANLVIIGEYVSDAKSYVTYYSAIVTDATFKVTKVLKGKYEADTINVTHYGGIVSASEYLSKQSEEELNKLGIDKSSISKYSSEKVEWINDEFGIYKETGKKYVLFLSYDQENNSYFVLADGYGMRRLSDDGYMYNLDTKSYDTKLDDLK